MNYYTADLHFCLESVIQTANRPFKNIVGMNYTIINNINNRVKKDDKLYINGDVSFAGADVDYIVHLLRKIHCKKVLIIGNHDRHLLKNKKFRRCFDEIHETMLLTDGEYDLFLSHCPHAEWDGFYKGRYHFYAHVHNKKDGGAALVNLLPQAINVGVDEHNFLPMTAEELIAWRKQTYQLPDTETFFDAVLHPEVDLTRSSKAIKFAETKLTNKQEKNEKKYDAVLGPNTNQWWAYDNETDEYCDPPSEILDAIDRHSDDINEQELYFNDLLAEEPDWLQDKEHRYDGDI